MCTYPEYSLQGRLRNCPEWECVSKCLDGPGGSDGHVIQLSANWSGDCPSKAARGFSSFCPVLRASSATSSWGSGLRSASGFIAAGQRAGNFIKYIFTFLLDVAITNSSCPSCPFTNIKSFRLQLAKKLTGEHCSRRRHGRGGTIIRPLPYRHFPITMEDEKAPPKYKRGSSQVS